MYKLILIFAVLILSINAVAFADQAEQVITLKDGSQIKGQLAGIENGVYTVKTPIIGDVHVAASDVASITNGSAVAAMPTSAMPTDQAGSASTLDQQVTANQQKLMSNPQSMQILEQMAQDP